MDCADTADVILDEAADHIGILNPLCMCVLEAPMQFAPVERPTNHIHRNLKQPSLGPTQRSTLMER